ncbi:MAG: anthranilate synthase component I [Clostridiales bacterium GWF2_36_10]|nr:MAG: anthranilate synthase component I [Clostridiales bacterium GWF2_36_10]HAN21807.1 anthranilate synthase component I [Clostridiales bacterium]
MNIYPEYDQVKVLAQRSIYKKIPICREMYSDSITPIEALRILKNVSHHCFMLESIEDTKQWGRYTFLGFDPTLELTCLNGDLKIKRGNEIKVNTTHPKEYIRKIITENHSPRIEKMPPFTGGLVGYFAYDYIKYSEPTLKLDSVDLEDFNDVDLMLFDKVIAFDNYKQKIQLIVNIPTDNIEIGYNNALLKLEQMMQLLKTGTPANIQPLKLLEEFHPLFSEEKYCEMVEKAKNYIYEGDIFQAVLSNRLEASFKGSLFDVYRVLRTTNPSPYMFYFSSDDIEIAGASPETLVKLQDSSLYTFPLAGTRPRGKTEEEDKNFEKELLTDEKECAEHNMLVDLGRNDIGRISEIGSVEVERYMSIERFSHVMHIGSTVKGKIRSDKDALDAVDAILPAGTLSGAPKIRACEIIDELEQNKRGIYGGAIGYIDFTGNLDTCIAIRIAYAKNGKIFIRSGAGIVADSVPKSEYLECLNKAQVVINAIKKAEEGI